ncbi:MAG TPA: TIGR03435 family protein [Bryobacteraceae bacterium]
MRATHVALRGCLQWAYGIVDVDGPDWITNESYDIAAKAAGPVSEAELRQMMQKLLKERFQLKLRREAKIASVGVLVVSEGGVKNLRAGETQGKLEIRREAGILYMKNVAMGNVANVMASPL